MKFLLLFYALFKTVLWWFWKREICKPQNSERSMKALVYWYIFVVYRVEGVRHNFEEVQSKYCIVGVRIIASKTLW